MMSCLDGLEYTDEGQLVGHLVMGVELLGKQIDQWGSRDGLSNDIAINSST